MPEQVDTVTIAAVAETPTADDVYEEDASERVGEELYRFLGEAKLTHYVPKLRDLLGAQTVPRPSTLNANNRHDCYDHTMMRSKCTLHCCRVGR